MASIVVLIVAPSSNLLNDENFVDRDLKTNV